MGERAGKRESSRDRERAGRERAGRARGRWRQIGRRSGQEWKRERAAKGDREREFGRERESRRESESGREWEREGKR